MPRTRSAERRQRPHMTSLELAPELKAGLDAVKERDGVPQSEQIRRAVRAWLEGKGIDLDALAKPSGRRKSASSRGRR
jgi:hypothetical protein